MLLSRIISSILILSLVGLIIFAFPNWVFALLTMAMIGVALIEFFGLVEKKGIFVYKYVSVAIGVLIPIIIYLQMGNEGYFALEPFFIVISCLFIFVLQFIRRDTANALTSISVTVFALLYISWFFSFFIKIRFLPDGQLFLVFLVLVTKLGDVGAYVVGRAFGRHSLIPRISPNKTVEGTIGGLVFSVAGALAAKAYLPQMPYGHLLVLGILLGILALVGDLAESLIKRDCTAKDSGENISGFGGMLDIMDSLLFTAPIFYFYIVILMKI